MCCLEYMEEENFMINCCNFMKFMIIVVGMFVFGFLVGMVLVVDLIVIKFSYVVVFNMFKGKGVDKFKELVEKYINGVVKVEIYLNL